MFRYRDLPPALQVVALRALDAEGSLRRSPRSLDTIDLRERLLQTTRDVLESWHEGRVAEAEAVVMIDTSIRELETGSAATPVDRFAS